MSGLNYSPRELRKPTAQVVTWLRCGHPPRPGGASSWNLIRRAAAMQGVGPYLHSAAAASDAGGFPEAFRSWLAEGYRWNAARMRRMQDELAAIFHKANRSGIRVMALKGSALIGRYYPDSALRPMADLDLLVEPPALAGLSAILEELGYQQVSAESGQAADRHLRFDRPEARIHSLDFEHPDNPRPVEVHTGLDIPLWGDVEARASLVDPWERAQAIHLDGEAGLAPDHQTLMLTLAFHHLQHLMVNTGRAIQWLDLCLILRQGGPAPEKPFADWLYPALRLSTRCFGESVGSGGLSALREVANPVLVRWSETVALDGRCGLNLGLPPDRRGRMALHWERWRPTRWRLALAYPATPYLEALIRHKRAILRQLLGRLNSRAAPAG